MFIHGDCFCGAGEGTRTLNPIKANDFKSFAYTKFCYTGTFDIIQGEKKSSPTTHHP